ncbi:MAG: site-specific DNA-methyltransferase [Alphaproteobacteria bacterium]|nr:site-specific DNA-methyltransferase [Alphaproteobacteria bacterium]
MTENIPKHPTRKPVAMVMDAIMDCSNRGEVILDPFAGSGTTLIAAERTGRRARLIELDPVYCDLIISRWERVSGRKALLADGRTFDEVRKTRQEDHGCPRENLP